MRLFDRLFMLIAAILLSIWLIAVVPISVRYIRATGSLSGEDPEKTAITIAMIVGFAIFWCLIAILVKLLFSDWLASGQKQTNPRTDG